MIKQPACLFGFTYAMLQLCYFSLLLFSLLSLSFLFVPFIFPITERLCIRNLLPFLTLPCMKFGKILWFSCFQIKSNIYGCYFSHGIFYHLLSLCFTISSCLHIVLIVNFVEANVWEIIQPNFISLSVDMPIFFSSYSLSTCLFADLYIFIIKKKQG